ncbi:MAG: hypothetical protein J6I52_02890 [Prevotella sp.]|nr:hypothetical protein [Prevotella sp.]
MNATYIYKTMHHILLCNHRNYQSNYYHSCLNNLTGNYHYSYYHNHWNYCCWNFFFLHLFDMKSK